MTTTAIDHTYRYGFASEYVPRLDDPDHGRLALAVDSSTLKKEKAVEREPCSWYWRKRSRNESY